jgi:hypothetical protein
MIPSSNAIISTIILYSLDILHNLMQVMNTVLMHTVTALTVRSNSWNAKNKTNGFQPVVRYVTRTFSENVLKANAGALCLCAKDKPKFLQVI